MDASQPSLLVKFSYRLCAKCTDVLVRYCEPYAASYWGERDSTRNAPPILGDCSEGKPNWAWLGHQLAASAEHCEFCRFLQQVSSALSCQTVQEEDYIVLKSHLVGSVHRETQYERYYRPKLQIFKKEGKFYASGPSTFLLPLAQSTQQWEDTNTPQIFHGRVAGAEANLPLIRHWLKICQTKHTPTVGTSELTSPSQSTSRLRSFHVAGSQRPSCYPETKCFIPNFRLIDVWKRCIVDASTGDEYAALSYVWGSVKRLVLCGENWTRLTAPGALSHDRTDVPRTFRDALLVAEQLGFSYLWIDALCIRQDNSEELISQMNLMDSIYGSAALTIVSNTDSVDTGMPGISYLRSPDQMVFKVGNKETISTKRTFAQALIGSPWESRGWTLQEKVFSKRLLIFTESQAFYHCSCATWFEDTILEPKDNYSGSFYLAERFSSRSKSPRQGETLTYEAHRPLFERNFWDLVKIYAQRQLSFERDALYAFSGILRSIAPQYGPCVWGVPQLLFSRGLSWVYSQHLKSLRRKELPSWSWAGWKGNSKVTLHFINTITESTCDIGIQWHYHWRSDSGEYILTTLRRPGSPEALRPRMSKGWSYDIADHPGGVNYGGSPMLPFNYSAH